MLAYDLADSGEKRLRILNDWLEERISQTFVDFAERDDCVGGSKRLEVCLCVAAFNNFPEGEFIAFLRTLPWQMRRSVQLIVLRQEDVRFQCIDVFREDEVSGDYFNA